MKFSIQIGFVLTFIFNPSLLPDGFRTAQMLTDEYDL